MKNIRKLLCTILAVFLLCCGFAGCQEQEAQNSTEASTTQSDMGGLEANGGFGAR